jgi:hypothetical protein
MFHFGTAEDNAKTYVDYALSMQGILLPDIPAEQYHELTGKELKGALVYLRIAARNATSAEADKETIDLLISYYDKVLKKILEEDPKFKEVICKSIHQPLNGMRKKYKEIAGCNG